MSAIDSPTPGNAADRIMRDGEVRQRTGLSRTTRWRMSRKDPPEFPPAVPLTGHAVGWKESAISKWIESRKPKSAAPTVD